MSDIPQGVEISVTHIYMGPVWRKARARMRTLDSCFWCGHKFEDGESMALAGPENGSNKLLCHACVDSANSPPLEVKDEH